MEKHTQALMYQESESTSSSDFRVLSDQKAMLLAKKIEGAVKEKQLTRQQFAHLMGVQPSIITRWLSGCHNFTVETLFDIENKLGVQLIAIDKPMHKRMNFHMAVGSSANLLLNSSLVDPFSVIAASNVTYYGGNDNISNNDCLQAATIKDFFNIDNK